MGAETRVQMEWHFHDSFFMNLQSLDGRNLSPELSRLVESSKEFKSLEEFGEFRKSLLKYADTAGEEELMVVSRLIRMTLIFLTSPLNETEMEQLMQIKIEENSIAQLVLFATDLQIIEFNKKILPIFTTDPSDIPSMDTSDMPLMGVNLIASLTCALMKSIMITAAPILITAAKSFFIAAPKFLFADDRSYISHFSTFMGAMFGHFDAKHMQLFYESLSSRFNYQMTKDWFQILMEMGVYNYSPRLLAMIGAILMNKETHEELSPNGKFFSELLLAISVGDKDDILWFLRNLNILRLLYKMNSIYLEQFLASPNLSCDRGRRKLKMISEAMTTVLMERLVEALSLDGPKRRLICMLIEYITAWTDSPDLIVNLTLRWVAFTENSEIAIKVVDWLMDLISKSPDFLSEQTAGLSENLFLKKTCEGVIFPEEKFRFADIAFEAKKRHINWFGLKNEHPQTVPDGSDVLKMVTDSRSLSYFLTGLYFNAPYAIYRVLTCSYYNVSSDELLDSNFPKHDTKITRIQCTTIELENEKFVSRTKLVISHFKFYACKEEKREDHEVEHVAANRNRKPRDMNHLYNLVLKNISRKRNFDGENETDKLSHRKPNLIADVNYDGSAKTDENSNLTVNINP